MTKKQSKILVNVLGITSVILMAASIFGITVYKRSLDETLYKEALEKSQIYTVAADIIERKTTEMLIEWEKGLIQSIVPESALEENPLAKTAVSLLIGTLVEQQTPVFVESMFDRVDLAEFFQSITEKKIDADISWLRGEKELHDVFGYIPTPEQIEQIKGSNFTQILDTLVMNSLGVNELPECQNAEEIGQNLARIAKGDVNNVTCTTEQISEVLAGEVDELAVSKVAGIVGGKADEITQESRINALLDDIYNLSYAVAQIKQIALDMRSDIQKTLRWLYAALGISFMLFVTTIFFTQKKKRFQKGVLLFFSSGVAVVFIALMHYIVFAHLLLRAVPFQKIAMGTNILTDAEGTLLINSIQFIVEYITTNLVSLSLTIGVWMVILSGIVYGVQKIYEHWYDIRNWIDEKMKK